MTIQGGGHHEREILGAYALGGLDPREAHAVQAHLAGCADCRREVAEFTELRRSLDQVPPEAFLDGPPQGGDLLLQKTLRQARAETASASPQVQRRTAWSGAAVAAAVVLVAIVLGGGILIGRQTAPEPVAQPPATSVPANAQQASLTDPQTGASLDVTVIPKAGWVWVNAKVKGVKAGLECLLRVVPKQGEPVLAGSWLVSEKGAKAGTDLQGTALVDPKDVQSVDVVTADGQTMVSVPL